MIRGEVPEGFPPPPPRARVSAATLIRLLFIPDVLDDELPLASVTRSNDTPRARIPPR